MGVVMTQRNFDRQMWSVQNLGVINSRFEMGRYEITEYEVEDWGKSMFVKRKKQPMREGQPMRIYYMEAFVIGPRGKVKQIYSTVY